MNEINWHDWFYYDETSQSCLRWKVARWSGKHFKRLNVAVGSEITLKDSEGYFIVRLHNKKYKAHRIIYELFKGKIDKGLVVDHIDNVRHNNKINNLRAISSAHNSRNAKKYSSNNSGVNGVSKQYSYRSYGTYLAYVANWVDLDGKKYGKSFAVTKYGEDTALRLAKEYRENMIAQLNELNAGYTETHGE
jgi:hypothetical protein